MKVVDLFSGAGGLSLGFCNAGFKIITAYDNWPEAIKTYKENFLNHRAKVIDLVELSNPKHPEILFLKKEKPEVIMGGPPCQDFSQAGSRNGNGEKGNLTPVFARIITTIRPEWVVMENVNTIKSIGKEQLKICIDILKEADYGLTLKILNAKDYGVPQNRKRLFLIGRLNGRDEEMSSVLESKKIGEITVREYYPEIAHGKNATEYYYRHPRTYGRRAIFSIDEVSPTIRGVNRPIPGTYKFHEGDKIKDKSLVRPLTYKERAILQSFPPDFKWTGSKANNEQLIGNAVPPKLASVIAESITFSFRH